MLLELNDGAIKSIDTDKYLDRLGCPTCGYGSEFVNEMTISMTKYFIYTKTNTEYEYAFSDDDLFKILLGNCDDIKKMNESEFIIWFKGKVLERDENAKFEITNIDPEGD